MSIFVACVGTYVQTKVHYISTNDVKAMEFYGSILKPWNVSRLGTRLACRIKLPI